MTGKHPVYTSHISEIRAVCRGVTKIHLRQELKAPADRAEYAPWISEFHRTLCRIYCQMANTSGEVAYFDDADFDVIRGCAEFVKKHPNCGQCII